MAKSKTNRKSAVHRVTVAKSVKTNAVDQAGECFTIMPFGGWFDDYYSNIYCPAIESAGLVPKRADDLYRPSAIVHDIWNYTKNCRLVLADLTGKNPNVFYELGLAHAIAKPAILVTESIADVPFDLRALRVLEYDKNDSAWGGVLRDKIATAIREVLESPLQSVLPSFLEVDKAPRAPVSEHQKELLEIRQELELVRRELRRSRDFDRHRTSPRDEADEMIDRYLSIGMPLEMIVGRVSATGVPESYILRRISQRREQSGQRLPVVAIRSEQPISVAELNEIDSTGAA